ncbi:MAG TPA: ATP-binding protein [Nitrospirota bacterium]|nr:ATP-binding protein [Nitrospirota bacterium]
MNLGLRTKILIIASAITLLVVVVTAVTSSYFFTARYLGALLSRTGAVAGGLAIQLERILALGISVTELQGFDAQCMDVVKRNEGIAYALVMSPDGKVLFHSDPDRSRAFIPSAALMNAIQNGSSAAEDPRTGIHAATAPVFNPLGQKVAVVVVGFGRDEIDRESRSLMVKIMFVGLCVLIVGMALLFAVLSWYVIRPITGLLDAIEPIRKGVQDYSARVPAGRGDELGVLGGAFNEMLEKIRERETELVQHREHLEAEVSKRTAELRQSEERYRLLMETSPNAISVVDAAGKTIMVNHQALVLFRIQNVSEAIGRDIFAWVDPDDQIRAADYFAQVLQGKVLQDAEIRVRKSDGIIFWSSINASLVRDQQGNPLFVIIVSADLTERKRVEAELLRTQKLDSLGVLAGGIAHDFNNLLQGVFGYLSLARMTLHDREKADNMLEQAEKALNLSINLTGQLLTFSKGGKPVKRARALSPIISTSVNFALSGSHSDSRITVPPDLWMVDADEGQISQVIQNISLNASEAMPEGGTVVITAENCELSAGHALLPAGGRFVGLSISDSGVGIPEGLLAKIFDPYFTTKQRGSGLGLATSYSIIKNHGGAIKVSSHPGKGSVFTVYLPAAGAAAEPEPHAAPTAVRRRGKVLVMDDEEVVRNVAREMIVALGHEVVCAAHGDDALARIKEARDAGKSFDVVILDLTIKGGMGGEQTIRRLNEIAPGTRAVVSSGYADSQVIADFKSLGFSAFLNKPYRIDSLKSCLDSLL